MTICCQQDYCHPCLKERELSSSSGAKQDCPNCSTPNLQYKKNEKKMLQITSLHVHCTHQGSGCVWEGELEWVSEHLERDGGCQYVLIACGNCGKEVRRREVREHGDKECPMRSVTCEFCQTVGTFEDITGSHCNECPDKPVECPAKCGVMVPRKDVPSHIQRSCTSVGMPCPFKSVGCTASPIPCKELEAHVASCSALHLSEMFQKFSAGMDGLRVQVKELQAENLTLKTEVARATRDMRVATESAQCLQKKTHAAHKTLVCELEYFYLPKHPTEMIAVECIKTQLASSLIHLQTGGSPATLRLDSYAAHKESGQVWYSPALYIHTGYKLCLAVHLNGVGAGKNSHVSIYLHQVVGERDEQLSWPYLLQDDVKVSLLLQTECEFAKNGHQSPRTLRFFRKARDHDTELMSQTLPPRASPILQRRRMMEESITPPKDHETVLVALESQRMATEVYLRRMNSGEGPLPVGPVVSKVELFSLQKRVACAVYRDSLVFQCCLRSSNLIESMPLSGVMSQ